MAEPDEIEITPEMMRAGADVIDDLARDVREGWVGTEEAAEKVYLAMQLSRRKAGQMRP